MKNRKICKLLSIVLTVSMIGCLTGCGANKDTKSAEDTSVINEANEEDALKEIISQQVKTSDTSVTPGKEETVYAIADSNGTVNKVIVSDWLKNPYGEDKIADATDLSDVKNVKGYEDYTEGKDGEITWNANGADIYYQGETTKDLPVNVKLSYTLDGESITPEELVGKSGKVTIRFDYENNATQTASIGGKDTDVCVPFAMISGMVLPTDKFANVEVTNGRLISEGSNDIVVGIALPGLRDSLDLNAVKDKLDDEEEKQKIDDLNIPDYVEVTADATDFELNMTMTMAMSDVLSNIDMTDSIDLSNINDSMDELKDADQKLLDGTGDLKDGTVELKDGTVKLKDGTTDLVDGVKDLKDGTVKLKDGTQELYTKSGDLDNGATKLNDGASDLKDGAKKLNDAAGTLKTGVSDLNDGAKKIKDGAASAKTGADKLVAGYEGDGTAANPGLVNASGQVTAGAAQVAAGATQVKAGVQTLVATVTSTTQKLGELKAGLEQAKGAVMQAQHYISLVSAYDGQQTQLLGAANQYSQGAQDGLTGIITILDEQIAEATKAENQAKITALLEGTATLETGANSLKAGTASMDTGIRQLYAGTKQLAGSEGLGKLSAGANDLANGTQTLTNKTPELVSGVSKLYDGTVTLKNGTSDLKDGTGKLINGTSDLKDGAVKLDDGANDLTDGAKKLDDGATDLDDGATKLDDGATELHDGMVKFDDEGISKLTDVFGDDIQDVIDRIDAIKNAGNDYKSFTKKAADGDGSVKFIIKTDAIKAKTE